jgi:hypothetical protein
MKRPFVPLGCTVMAHVKPKNRQSWDVHADTGFNIGTAMEYHQCFHIYIVKTRVTRISDTVFFKQQYITNPQVTPKTLVIKAALDLTSALKVTISRDGKMAEALQTFSKLFTKIAAAKSDLAIMSNGTTFEITPMHAKMNHFQGWPEEHLPQQAIFQGCQKKLQRLTVESP